MSIPKEEPLSMDLFDLLRSNANAENAAKMSAYMKNKFPFLGIPKPERKALSRDFLSGKKKDRSIDWDFVFRCYGQPEREFHYLALDYLNMAKKLLTPADLGNLEKLIVTNPWWDSADSIDALVGEIYARHPEEKGDSILRWAKSDNIWLKRVSIDFQLQRKENTDTELLSKAILRNTNTGEFFVNKAIGWSLRAYSRTDREWVRRFLSENALSALSVREASKYL